jgi:predicted regulator of Ras-like GTPase activity (Roadblock/LC7/MglB family)
MITARVPSPSHSLAAAVISALLALLPVSADAEMRGGERIAGSGVTKTETRSVSGFHAVVLGVHARLKLRQGDGEGLSITGDDNIVPLVETVVEDGALRIRWADKRNYSTDYKGLEIVVNARNIDGLIIAGSGEIRSEKLKTANLHAVIAGSGAMSFDSLDTDSFVGAIHGSGHLSAAGRADSLEATVAGSGQLSAAKLESRNATITLAGSSTAAVWAKDELNATVAGSGGISYYGKPQLNTTVAGSGRIKPAGNAS